MVILPLANFALQHMQFHPVLNSQSYVYKLKLIWDIWINPVLNLLADNEGEQGNNKTGGKYSSYIMIICQQKLSQE